MIILAIETSCDETGISILKITGESKNPRFEILSNIVASQVKVHSQWRGVVPSLAKREHQKNLPIVLKKALKKAGLDLSEHKKPKIDVLAVTQGPGLEPALWTGINFAKALSVVWEKPLVAVNHMEGHIVSSLLETKSKIKNQKSKTQTKNKKFTFPALALLVSGGHTQLVLIKKWGQYKIIGETLDDAAGEAFDKVARMLNLGYPGGPAIAKAARGQTLGVDEKTPSVKELGKIQLPRPMLNSKDYNFSFSGLKTAVLYKIKELGIMNQELKAELVKEFQQAVIDVLITKTIRAAKEYKAKTIILGGGVAANKELRQQLKKAVAEASHIISDRQLYDNLLLPSIKFTGDNAAMIALAAYFKTKKKEFADLSKLKANGNLKLR